MPLGGTAAAGTDHAGPLGMTTKKFAPCADVLARGGPCSHNAGVRDGGTARPRNGFAAATMAEASSCGLDGPDSPRKVDFTGLDAPSRRTEWLARRQLVPCRRRRSPPTSPPSSI